MIPKLSDILLESLTRMLEVQTHPKLLLHTDTGQLEFISGWSSPEAEENFKFIQEQYIEALQMEAQFIGGK